MPRDFFLCVILTLAIIIMLSNNVLANANYMTAKEAKTKADSIAFNWCHNASLIFKRLLSLLFNRLFQINK